jgi:DNA-binding MarR family transcriptional regulator
MSATARETADATCSFVLGEDGVARWSDVHASAWIGLLETHKALTRALDAELEARHGLSLSAVELLGRLAAADGHSLRLSELASACGLSLSRISRLMDALETRGLVERRCVPSDARAVDGHLTEAGLELVREAQATHFASVQRRFFDALSEDEIKLLASVFERFAAPGQGSCTAPQDSPAAAS